jgi:hypothetical protein
LIPEAYAPAPTQKLSKENVASTPLITEANLIYDLVSLTN